MKIKLLYLSNSASRGGMENHLLDLISGLSKSAYKIYLFCPDGELVSDYRKGGANVVIDYPRLDLDPFYILRVYRFFKKEKIQIFHAHQLKAVINGLIAAKLARTPVKIAHIHSPLNNWQIPRLKKYLDIFVNFFVTNLCADIVLALSEATKKERIQGEYILSSKIKVIPNGIDTERYKVTERQRYKRYIKEKLGLTEDTFIVGTFGRLTIEKGVKYFVEAVPEISKRLPQGASTHFVIAGDGPLRRGLESEVKKRRLQDKVTFLGFIKEEEKVKILSGFDIFVFPTLHEGFGLVLGEAMSMGIPTVSSDLPVLKEITGNGESGVHFKKANSDDLALKVVNLLEEKKEQERLSKLGITRIKNYYSLEKFIENYDRLYKSTLKL